jgi:hypothetical protein
MAFDPTSKNLAIWLRAEPTDPAYVKAITGKQYKGSSPNPTWIAKRLTEEFGPVGWGWGYTNVRFTEVTDPTNAKVVSYAHITFFYFPHGRPAPELQPVVASVLEVPGCAHFEQIGGTESAGVRKSSGDPFIDEDGRKKSLTDAIVKAASHIGFAGDIFLGRWDDNKYVEERAQAEAAGKRVAEAKAGAVSAADVAKKVQQLCEDLGNITTQEALLKCRADALELAPKLKELAMRDEHQTLGAAMKAATTRLQPQQAAA